VMDEESHCDNKKEGGGAPFIVISPSPFEREKNM